MAMSDVYAGDDDLQCPPQSAAIAQRFHYVVIADADPDVLLKVASQFLLTNALPQRLLLTRPTSRQVTVEVELIRVSPVVADAIRRKLLQMTCAQSVSLIVQRS
jgi:hypothetical protein